MTMTNRSLQVIRRIRFLLLAVSILPSSVLAGQIYWSDETTDTIQRANLDGSGLVELIGVADAEEPGALALDLETDRIYWTAFANFSGVIKRANLDGTNVEGVGGTGSKSRPGGIDLDLDAGKMIITDPSDCDFCGFIDRANLDGTGSEHILTGLNFPFAIAIDPPSGVMWWTSWDAIYRGNLDGTGMELLVGDTESLGIAVDPGGGKIYWTDRERQQIRRADLDGTNVEELVTSGLDRPYGITLDLMAAKMYWTDRNLGTIRRADLDGSNVEDVVVGLPRPTGVALDPRGDGQPVPGISAWGLMVMALLLLAIGTVLRRQRTAS
jgi:hypothetical protein